MTRCMPGRRSRWSRRPGCPTWRCCATRRSARLAGLAVCDLCRRYGVEPPAQRGLHFTADLGPFRLKWERHTEFIRFMFIVEGTTGDPFERPAIAVLPEDWVAALPGQIMVAAHAALIQAEPSDDRSGRDRQTLVRRQCADRRRGLRRGGDGTDGFPHPCRRVQPPSAAGSRTTPWQAGRIVQRLLEIDTYRIMALLALPVAREAGPLLSASERELAQINASLVTAGEASRTGAAGSA